MQSASSNTEGDNMSITKRYSFNILQLISLILREFEAQIVWINIEGQFSCDENAMIEKGH